jgi:hypothetical protein
MKGIEFLFVKSNTKFLLVEKSCGGICYVCGSIGANLKYKYYGKDYHRCKFCTNGQELKIENVKFDDFELLEQLRFYDIHMISNIILYHIGKLVKIDQYTKDLETNAYKIYYKTLQSVRNAIYTFCLYCIRYQKDKVNKDIRRKICELIWEDKIKFIS